MEDGVLVVIKASSCGACIHLTEIGLFDSLLTDLNVFDVEILELETPTGFDKDTEGYEVLNIDPWYPSFKYMTMKTHDSLGSVPTREALQQIRLYNGEIVNGKYVKNVTYSKIPTLQSIQQFCDNSARILAQRKRPQEPSPKYKRR